MLQNGVDLKLDESNYAHTIPRPDTMTWYVPVELWHEAIGDPTLADAILDRLVHNAYRLDIKGESMREARGIPQTSAVSSTRQRT